MTHFNKGPAYGLSAEVKSKSPWTVCEGWLKDDAIRNTYRRALSTKFAFLLSAPHNASIYYCVFMMPRGIYITHATHDSLHGGTSANLGFEIPPK